MDGNIVIVPQQIQSMMDMPSPGWIVAGGSPSEWRSSHRKESPGSTQHHHAPDKTQNKCLVSKKNKLLKAKISKSHIPLDLDKKNYKHTGPPSSVCTYIVLLKLPVLFLHQDLLHHRHGLPALPHKLLLLEEQGDGANATWGSSSKGKYSKHH